MFDDPLLKEKMESVMWIDPKTGKSVQPVRKFDGDLAARLK